MGHMTHVKESTIVSVSKNHPAEWEAAFDSLPSGRAKNGRKQFTDEERRRLATLKVLVDKGVYKADRQPEVPT